MKGSIPEDIIEEIRRRTEIVSLIGEYVVLKKAGKNFLGLCPFHHEKTPSFTVSPDKQMFYCFGCSEGGNAVSFLMKLNNLTFPEAVRQLAGKVGVVIPEKRMSRDEKERYTLAEHIRRVNEVAAGFFTRALSAPAGEGARAYLRKRGIGEAAIKAFRLGLAPDGWRNLADFLERERISLTLAEQAGLVVPREGRTRGYYDRFRGRLMIPVEDVDGRVIAFGGRLMAAGEPKYMNSPESAVYTKGNNLFGLARTRTAIRENGFAVLVEGYFDLIALWDAGILNVVATLGTALTRSQVDLIRRYATDVVAIFDPDEAGKKALARSLELFLSGNVHARAVILPDGQDPDDFVRKRGRQEMDDLIAHAWPMADYYIERILGGKGTIEEDRDKLREAIAFVGRIENVAERNLFEKKVAEALNVDEGVLKAEVQRTVTHSPVRTPAEQLRRKAPAEYDPLEMSLIQMMLEYPERISAVAESGVLDCFRTGDLKSLGEELLAASREGRPVMDASSFVGLLSEGPLREKLLARLVQESPYPEELIDRQLTDAIRKIKKRSCGEKRGTLRRRIAEAEKAKDQGSQDLLVAEWNRLREEEKGLAS